MAQVDDDDILGGRTVSFKGGGKNQREPESDNRYRVNDFVKFYVVQLGGAWVNVSESAQRVLTRSNRQSYVTFEAVRHQLRPANNFKGVLEGYVKYGCPVYLSGLDVTKKNIALVEPWPFIWIAPKVAREAFQAYWIDKTKRV